MATGSCEQCGRAVAPEDGGLCPVCLLQLGVDRPLSLMKGAELGGYRIGEPLGVGGMGEVYRALDPGLGREVAIKVLPDFLAAEPERVARFRREARLLATLNHPNIAAIYGFEERDGLHFLVLELVEGLNLSERMRAGRVSIQDALEIAAQMAHALSAAHDAGVIHRDLKPSNVKVDERGRAKVLDFGLAKAFGDESAQGGEPGGASITQTHTRPGVVMGTAPYMSPEQIRGRPLDRRTDIWSFGCVVFELLSGTRSFDGETASDVMARVLERDPDWESLPRTTPARVRDLLERCLEKDPRRRLRDVGDAAIELERALASREWTASGAVRARVRPGRRLRRVLPWAMTAVVAVAALAVGWSLRPPSPVATAAGEPLHVLLSDPEHPHVTVPDTPTVSVSADGRTLVYAGDYRRIEERTGQEVHGVALFLRRPGSVAARVIDRPLTTDANHPFVSPDGRWLGHARHDRLVRRSIGADTIGPASDIGALPAVLKGATWIGDRLLLSPAANAGLAWYDPQARTLETVTVPDAGREELAHRWPSALPDGRHVLFTIKRARTTSFDQADIALLDLEAGTWKTLHRGGSYPRYSPTGHVLFARGGALHALPFDAAAGRVTGSPVTVLEGVMTAPGSGAAYYDLAAEVGTLVYVPGGPDVPQREIVWIDREGEVSPSGIPPGNYPLAALSPDGTRVAMTVFGANDAVYVHDFRTGRRTRVGGEDGNSEWPVWFPDGRRLLISSDRGGHRAWYAVADDDGVELALDHPRAKSPDVATIDGRDVIVYDDDSQIDVAPVGGGEARRIVDSPAHDQEPAVSPDNRWLAYTSNDTGRSEVYVRRFPSGGGRWQMSSSGGTEPMWSADSRELLYTNYEREVFSVRVPADGDLAGAVPVLLFTLPPRTGVLGIHPDGDRFYGLRELEREFPGTEVRGIVNWYEELGRRLAAGS